MMYLKVKEFTLLQSFFSVLAYEYVPDSEIASITVATSLLTGQSGSEEDLLGDKVVYNIYWSI